MKIDFGKASKPQPNIVTIKTLQKHYLLLLKYIFIANYIINKK